MLEELKKYPLTSEDEGIVKDWEDRLKKHDLYRTFREHPVSQEIAQEVVNSIRMVNEELLRAEYTNGATDISKIKELVIKRNVWSNFLSLFGDYNSEELLKKEIEESIKIYKNYYGTN